MNITFERYKDKYGGRVKFALLPFAVSQELKAALPFPQSKWDGSAWSIQDKPDVVNKALQLFTINGLEVYGLDANDCQEYAGDAHVVFAHPDKLVMEWSFQPNYKDINSAMKQAAAGNAVWNRNTKKWSIPVNTAIAVANAVRPHFSPLADAIENCPQVHTAQKETVQRIELSSAVDTELELPDWPIFANMRPYQRVAPIMYRTGGRNRILIADEMGLGKSLQALGCVEFAEHQQILIVCPSIVKHNWGNEIVKWLNGDFQIINGRQGEIKPARFHIINYDILSHRLDDLMGIGFDCIIFDEVHNIKNQKAARTKAALALAQGKEGIIALSGTPILNRPNEFFTPLNMMLPAQFGNYWTFAQRYCNPRRTDFGWDFSGASNIEHSTDGTPPLNTLLRDFMLRRSMDDPRISKDMPDLIQSLLRIDLPEQAKKAYKIEYNSWLEEWTKQQANYGSADAGFALNMMTQLRHIAGKLKVEAAVKWALEYHERTGKPLVIFAHHVDVVSNLLAKLRRYMVRSADTEDERYEQERRAGCIVGSTTPAFRQKYIEEFQEGKIDFLVCSTTAMREGVNLDRANTTLFVEREWVPAWEQQAAARVRRLTQEDATCHQVILSANDTIDTMFDEVVSAKAHIVKKSLDGSTGQRNDIVKDLVKKLKLGKVSII